MKCPNCGHERKKQDDEITPKTDCPSCGIVYTKFKQKVKLSKCAEKNLTGEPRKHEYNSFWKIIAICNSLILVLFTFYYFSPKDTKNKPLRSDEFLLSGARATGKSFLSNHSEFRTAYITGMLDGVTLSPAFTIEDRSNSDWNWFAKCTEEIGSEKVVAVIDYFLEQNNHRLNDGMNAIIYSSLLKTCRGGDLNNQITVIDPASFQLTTESPRSNITSLQETITVQSEETQRLMKRQAQESLEQQRKTQREMKRQMEQMQQDMQQQAEEAEYQRRRLRNEINNY